MRNLAIVLTAVVGLAACGGGGNLQSVSLTGPARASGEAATECVRNELRDMGYEVSTRQSPETITGIRRNDVVWYYRFLGLRPTVDQIDARLEQGQLRVAAFSSANLVEGPRPGELASEAARANAEQLLRECGRSG